MMNMYSVPLEYLVNSKSYLNFKFEGKIKFITVTLWPSVVRSDVVLPNVVAPSNWPPRLRQYQNYAQTRLLLYVVVRAAFQGPIL
jgi:hypothetical protein